MRKIKPLTGLQKFLTFFMVVNNVQLFSISINLSIFSKYGLTMANLLGLGFIHIIPQTFSYIASIVRDKEISSSGKFCKSLKAILIWFSFGMYNSLL